MKWADIRAVLTKDSVRKKERLELLKSIESAWNAGGSDQVEAWLRRRVEDTITQAQKLQSELVANREATGEEDSDDNED